MGVSDEIGMDWNEMIWRYDGYFLSFGVEECEESKGSIGTIQFLSRNDLRPVLLCGIGGILCSVHTKLLNT